MTTKVKVGIIGASGYSGEELLRLLYNHPYVKLVFVTSRQYAGKKISEVYPRFSSSDMVFCKPDVDKLASKIDYCFLALPHGLATEYALPLLKNKVRVIDISADFRLEDNNLYEKYYGGEAPRTKLEDIIPMIVYGTPERYRGKIKTADLVACPGCYPTSSVLAIYPFLKADVVEKENIIIYSMSGVTGAGRTVKLPFVFGECNESARAYGVIGHRHLPEIEQELSKANGVVKVNFIPHLIPLNRGILSTITMNCSIETNAEKLHSLLEDYYRDEPFVRVLPLGKLADIKDVSWSNYCELSLSYDQRTSKIIVHSSIDNLTKGASGQAIQCFNIMASFEETTAL